MAASIFAGDRATIITMAGTVGITGGIITARMAGAMDAATVMGRGGGMEGMAEVTAAELVGSSC
ncbi:hypothetical protein [Cupriavidus sp. AU9028]|uniref:hypothetical protein n=1 Tax=Cupriavidus sp. AU9028 TaxID=2871157 RepID=UPI001C983987|nr:hypothetical protein [Cupriavidus sp. AU9028]MBY4898280.1 hypothetical protein [Cupriavidus sp. AU9028]